MHITHWTFSKGLHLCKETSAYKAQSTLSAALPILFLLQLNQIINMTSLEPAFNTEGVLKVGKSIGARFLVTGATWPPF